MKRSIVASLLFTAVIMTGCRQSSISNLGKEYGVIDPLVETRIHELVEESGVPNIALGLVVGDELVWAKGFGQETDLSTVYSVGSIDKSFTATAVMQLVERGMLNLDDDVNQYLPFSVRHPDYPETAITVRMLLTHSSGLPHDLPGTRYLNNDGPMLRWTFTNGDYKFMDLYRSIIPLNKDSYLKEIFSKDSKYGSDFWVFKPGTKYQYSNSGYYLLLGSVIEGVTGQDFQEYITENIIQPLGMENTSYRASDFPKEQLAPPFENTEDQGYSPLPLTGANATGKLRTTVVDLARFLMFHMNAGELDGVRLLEPESIDQMHYRTIPMMGFDFPGLDFTGVGYGWTLWGDGLQGHGGATPGYYAQILYNEGESGPYGVVIMMTYGCSITECDFDWFDQYFVVIREILLDHGANLTEQQTNSK